MSAAKNLPRAIVVPQELQELMGGFVKNRLCDLNYIKTSIEKNDWDEAKRFAHSITGVAGGYGFYELGEHARHIEQLIETKDKEKILVLVSFLKDYMSEVQIFYK